MRVSRKNLLAILGLVMVPLILLSAALIIMAKDREGSAVAPCIFLIGLSVVELLVGSLALLRWQRDHLSRPFKQLQQAAGEIRDGNLDHELDEAEEDEFRRLFESFEEMRLRLKNSAEEQLRTEQDGKILLANISHDLKTPITAIKGYVEGLRDGVASTPEKQARYLSTIYSKAEEMEKLVDQLYFYTLVESGRIPYHFIRIPAHAYFSDCRWELKEELDAQDMVTRYENRVPEDVMIAVDPEQLHRVVSNVVSNAVKYRDRSKEKNMIGFRIYMEGKTIVTEIEDNGVGIAPEDLPHVFDRFYRADTARSASTGGNGIGLSIVQKIMEDHGGRAVLTSVKGEGSCMRLELPVYEENDNEPDTDRGRR
ncbi:MAG: HAMP domain-containing histidine kinase [Lachnospiraceae bacterium]|nr:HAMP domain-containing histidine kinase [Lachnospiraceae bacterium]